MYENAPLEFRTNDTVRMTISSSGEVGIGTSSPINALHIRKDAAGQTNTPFTQLLIDGIDTDNDENGIMFATSGGHTFHGAWIGGVRDSAAGDSSGNLLFKTKSSGNATTTSNLTTKMFIKHDGKVGIGTTSPAYKLHTVGDIKVESGAIGVNVNPSATDGRIDAGNDVVAYSSSDIRFKKNITPIQDALFKVQQIQGIEFDWIPNEEQHGYDGHDVGVIAQEVVEVLPEVVQIRESGYMAVKYEKMIPLLVEGIKEQQKQIDELKDKVRELEDA